MFTITLLIANILLAGHPIANGDIDWDITEQALQEKIKEKKIDTTLGHGHSYSDFNEINPTVYIDDSFPDKKFEFYFHKGKLYKIYTIYRNQDDIQAFYQQKIEGLKNKLGQPNNTYTDELFSMSIQHHVWETKEEQLDLRLGGGYVYEVRIEKSIAQDKQTQIELKHAI